MPARVTMLSWGYWGFSRTREKGARTAKSAHPGQHVGWSAVRTFLVSGDRWEGAEGERAVAGEGMAVKVGVGSRVAAVGAVGPDLAGHAVGELADPEGEPVGLGDAADGGKGVAGAQHGRQLAEPVEALVVHLDDQHVLVAAEDPLEARRQGGQVAQVELPHLRAAAPQAVHGLADGPPGRAPADDKGLPLGVAVHFRHGKRRDRKS